MRQPFRAIADRHAHRFGRAVVLEDDRAPPVDHRPLDRHGTGRCGVDCDLERGEIISAADGLRQFQHAREHGRHKLGVSDAILRDEIEEALLVEALHDDDRPAAPERAADPGQRRGVIERRRREIDLAFAKPPDIQPRGERRQRLIGRLIGQRTQHALGSPGGARGIEHRRSERLVANRRCGKLSGRLRQIAQARACPGPIDDETEFDLGAIAQRRERDLALRLRRDEHLRLAVVDDIGEFACGQKRIDGSVIEPGSLARRAALDEPRMVLHEDGVVVEPPEANRAQEMRQTVAARFELAIGDGFARSPHDDGRLVGARFGMPPRIHASDLPWRSAGLLLAGPEQCHRRRSAPRLQRPSTAIKLSTPTGEMRNSPE